MYYKDNILPLVGMNRDDDPRHFEKGDYLEARNVNIGSNADQGDLGLVNSIKSGVDYGLPSTGGTELSYQHVATAVDEENDKAYLLYIVEYGAGPNDWWNVITEHDLTDNTFTIVLQQPVSIGKFYEWDVEQQAIYNPRIVDGNLVLTDNVNDIYYINMARMKKSTEIGITDKTLFWTSVDAVAGYSVDDFVWHQDRVYVVIQDTTGEAGFPSDEPTYYTDKADVNDVYLDVSDIHNFTLAALPPLIAPTAVYGSSSSVKINQLRGKTWQFTYRYIYFDYRKSTYAPPSLVPPPDKEESLLGVPNPDPTHNNRIDVSVNSGNEEVRSIQVIARSSEDPATWFLINEYYITVSYTHLRAHET